MGGESGGEGFRGGGGGRRRAGRREGMQFASFGDMGGRGEEKLTYGTHSGRAVDDARDSSRREVYLYLYFYDPLNLFSTHISYLTQ
jgi:hypothetical protein